jgi:ABC-type branched-subunit amino acid transport system permease subunit
VLLPLTRRSGSYATVLLADIFVAALFASSLHFILGPGGMHSFGHAAYFGLGAYGAALLVRTLDLPMEAALLLGPGRRCGRPALWLVLRAAVGRLSDHADAGVCADQLGHRLSVG